ncbi:MAG: hypothetical protein KZQ56_07810 [gamma proteobacterium symbiont of Lucinoma myriamae]|nr:hypothetical protein [gamma proteobacterium symbiont of Lucinoma myriamae]
MTDSAIDSKKDSSAPVPKPAKAKGTITRGPGKRAQEARRQFLRSVALTVGVLWSNRTGYFNKR